MEKSESRFGFARVKCSPNATSIPISLAVRVMFQIAGKEGMTGTKAVLTEGVETIIVVVVTAEAVVAAEEITAEDKKGGSKTTKRFNRYTGKPDRLSGQADNRKKR
jgi:hypothetical protein